MDIRRRSFLTFLGTLPVVSDWMRIFGSTHTKSVKSVKKQEPKDEEWEAKFRAVETLRVINTAEKWHFVATKQHSPLGQLHQTESYKKLIEIAGQHRFKRAFDNFPPDGRIELQGYDILVETTADRSRYLATVSMKGPTYTFVFASDESGMIYEGRPLGNGNGASEANWSLDNLIADKHPLGQLQKPEPRRNTLLAMISPSRILDFLLSALPPQSTNGCHCCSDFPCSCSPNCACSSTCPDCDGSHCCFDCGCPNCTWCLFTTCRQTCPINDCAGDCDTCCGSALTCRCCI